MEYRFEIKASSIRELEDKIDNFARAYCEETQVIAAKPLLTGLEMSGPPVDIVPFPDMPPQAIAPIDVTVAPLPEIKPLGLPIVLSTTNQNDQSVIAAMESVSALVQTAGAPHALDSAGFPWDDRIHSTGESKNKDGTWRTRRGVDPELVKQIQAQFRGVAYVPPAPVAVAQPAATLPVFADVPKDKVQDPVSKEWEYKPLTAPVPAAAAPSVAVPTPPNTVAYSYQSFKDNFFSAMTQLINLGKINQPYVQQLTEYYQLKQIWDITKNEVQCQNLFNNFVATGLIHEVKNG